MSELIIKYKIFESSMIIKLWIYNEITYSTYVREVKIDDSFLE